MSVRTRDWLKFGTLVLVAFVLGVALTSASSFPRRARLRSRCVDSGDAAAARDPAAKRWRT